MIAKTKKTKGREALLMPEKYVEKPLGVHTDVFSEKRKFDLHAPSMCLKVQILMKSELFLYLKKTGLGTN